MNRNLKTYIIKIIVFTFIFSVVLNIYLVVFEGDTNSKVKVKSSNIENFVKVDDRILSHIGVAMTLNIGGRYKQANETPINIYKDVMDISYILANKNIARDKIITKNMVYINEYLNILKTDIRYLLDSSTDREMALDVFINQLEFRYKNGIKIIKTLKQQKSILIRVLNQNNQNIKLTKNQIQNNFKNFDTGGVIENIDKYLEEKDKATYARTYIVFIDKFLKYFILLNNQNKIILDTLINNKEILIKNTQVVIPDSSSKLLKKIKIIYDEKDWKQK